DDKDKLSLIVDYYWDGAQWVNSSQNEFTYGSNEELLTIVYSSWNGNSWSNPEKFENVYDSSGNITQSTISYLDEEQWIVDQAINYEYDLMGNRTLLDVYYSDINLYREESVYDEQGNRAEYSIYELNWDTELLEKSRKTETSYDNSFAFEDLILPFMSEDEEEAYDDYYNYEEEELDLELLFKHKLLRLVSFEGDGENWLPESDYILEYSEQNVTSIGQENSGNKMSVYPNPASSQLTFFLEGLADSFQIKIFDMQGKVVISQLAENNTPISLESLNDGVYFYRLKSKGNNFSGKLVVKK
ncbi:MAG: T9SS type A sorting domain-containing protein, partial [Bacteroides sp.]|nr:T9SS type A sorting domain-containing protein [Bacteroides sp.]